MSRFSRFWAYQAVGLGVWEALAITTHKVPTISNTVARTRTHWPLRTLVGLVAWASSLVTYLYTHKATVE